MEKTWAPLHRRPAHSLPVHDAFHFVFDALSRFSYALPSEVVVPMTATFTHSGCSLYVYSPRDERVVQIPKLCCDTSQIVDLFSKECAIDGATDIAAVWYTDIDDSKGVLSTVEYLTQQALRHLLDNMNSRKIVGVLQQFVQPRLRLGVESVNQELFFAWTAREGVTVERRYSVLDIGAELHPTLRCLVSVPIQVTGKLTCLTAPFSPQDSAPAKVEVLPPNSSFISQATTLCDYVISALEATKNAAPTYQPRGVASLTLQCKVARHNKAMYLLSVSQLRLPADHGNAETAFEILPPCAKYPPAGPSSFEHDLVVTPIASVDHFDFSSLPLSGVAPAPRKPHLRSSVFACPNCDEAHAAEDFVSVRYESIVKSFLQKSRSNHDHLVHALRSLVPQTKRPQSAYVKSVAKVSSDDEQIIFTADHLWCKMPLVLKKAKICLVDLLQRRVWMRRCVSLCRHCAAEFEDHAMQRPSLSKFCAADMHPQPPACCRSSVIDQLVITPLQQYHQEIRRAEREKFEMRASIDAARSVSAKKRFEQNEKQQLEKMLSSLSAQSCDVMLPGGQPDIPLSMMLESELYDEMTHACTVTPPLLLADVRFKPPSFPSPPVCIDIRGVDDATVRKERLLLSNVHVGRKYAYHALCHTSKTFGELSGKEKELAIEAAGEYSNESS